MPTELERLTTERDALRARVQELTGAQEEFLRAVSHDLRAPLRHVTSYAALLREVLQELPEPPAQVQEALGFAATMEQSARRMAAMIDGLQTLSRAARAPLRLAAVDLAQAVREAAAGLPRGAAVAWDIAPQLPALQADAVLLQQLLGQLLDNAAKFSGRQSAPRVAVLPAAAESGRVAFTISDNGVGFDPAHAQGLFGVFQRLHRDGEFDGVGAGLALCKLIAERHGARIGAAAQPGAGCTITLDWPALPAA
ncbi:sensor histidine kinase [Comamonas badia]|jgi:light-regulated signal transduction histidine kinase (bacteriophytochrome)|uniref:sensor histidine kinase n=1 Tax=Comamonas badia TaxID=265291 RepID=UPI000402DD02|nr:ATP-binding protein [Comamonas badia]